MKDELEKTVKALAAKAAEAKTAPDALHYSQAALNAAQALTTVTNIELAAEERKNKK